MLTSFIDLAPSSKVRITQLAEAFKERPASFTAFLGTPRRKQLEIGKPAPGFARSCGSTRMQQYFFPLALDGKSNLLHASDGTEATKGSSRCRSAGLEAPEVAKDGQNGS